MENTHSVTVTLPTLPIGHVHVVLPCWCLCMSNCNRVQYTSFNRAGPREALGECALARHAPCSMQVYNASGCSMFSSLYWSFNSIVYTTAASTHGEHTAPVALSLSGLIWFYGGLQSSVTTCTNSGSLTVNSSRFSSPRYFM